MNCNTKLEFYGISDKGDYKYSCPKCYNKTIKYEKGDYKCQATYSHQEKKLRNATLKE